jgi:2-keto-4-pentenoate hydratase
MLTTAQKAQGILELFRDRRHVAVLPAELYPADLDDAYRIRREYQRLEEEGGRGAVAGYKIALTTPVMQQLCGVHEPCWGAIFKREVYASPARLQARDYCRIAVETEIAMRLGDDVPLGTGRDAVADKVEACAAAIELIEDLNYDYKRIDAPALVAGNAWNAGIVLGAVVAGWRGLDLAKLRGECRINGNPIGAGVGGDVMGHPLNALAWLADKLAAAGTPLKRGMVVMTGSIVATQFPKPGDRVEISIEGLGAAALDLV